MKVLFAASEAHPFAKTGGLGDVAASLPAALAKKRIAVRGIMPLYGSICPQYRSRMKKVAEFRVQLAWRNLYAGLFMLKENGVKWYFIDNEYYFKRVGHYGYQDDGERYAFFSLAVIEALPYLDCFPDVIHANDWQTALIPSFLKLKYGLIEPFNRIKTLLTIHNIQYQGNAHSDFLESVCGIACNYDHARIFANPTSGEGVNLLKAGIELADGLTTVSPTYAAEIQHAYFAHGLEQILRRHSGKLRGIVNGIDTAYYCAQTSPLLAKNFTRDTLADKAENKCALQRRLGLSVQPELPVFAIISRLVAHKGLDLIGAMLDRLLALPVQLAVLGQGDFAYETLFAQKAREFPGRVSANITFSEDLAFQIYAGSDFLLMPSKSEPCGLSQMIAMQFATVPIVRSTGGLNDTVQYFYNGAGNGLRFDNYNSDELFWTVEKALAVYYNKPEWVTLQKNCMASDFTWANSAAQYSTLYKQLIANT